MYELKILTTFIILVFMAMILFFCRGLSLKKNRASLVGFGLMELTYLLSLICMWW